MREKYDRYECNVKFVLNSHGKTVIFDELEGKELRLSDSIKVINVRRESEKVITGRMVVNSPSQGNKLAFASIVKLDMDVDKAKIFILIHAMRNMSAHFERMKGDDKFSRFRGFIYNHAKDYKNPIRQLVYE